MSIVRGPKPDRYSIVNNELARNPDLSWDERGILVYLLSFPEGWHTSAERLARDTVNVRDGLAKVRGILRRLEEKGYLQRTCARDEAGRWQWTSVVHEQPVAVVDRTNDSSSHLVSVVAFTVGGETVGGNADDLRSTDSCSTEERSTRSSLHLAEQTDPPLLVPVLAPAAPIARTRRNSRATDPAVEQLLDAIRERYPRHHTSGIAYGGGTKTATRTPLVKALREGETAESLLVAIGHYADSLQPGDFVAHTATWLNQRRWENFRQPIRLRVLPTAADRRAGYTDGDLAAVETYLREQGR